MKHRFQVIEYASGFAVQDIKTGKEAWMSDGVDCLFTPTGKAVSPGSKGFVRRLQSSLNANPDETGDAYFGRAN